ncbi:Hypoxanthine phosphoribosyltransferase [Candidatus Hartigia pinicola]|nr:Hypoxanthine phosphoribosyltransferase [Candidatus Hartigia pinicola]
MKFTLEMMISAENLNQRVSQLAEEISIHYKHVSGEQIIVGLLKGSFIFMADLCRKIQIPHKIDFMTVSSYRDKIYSSRDVKIVTDLQIDIYDRHVLIIEDIIDSGNTLNQVREIFKLRGPKSIAICTLLDKPSRREVDVPIKWIGYSIEDKFVVGYGIDYAQKYRYLPYIACIKPNSKSIKQ